MTYIFENEAALELYYTITKEMKINITPKGEFQDDTVYMSESWLMDSLKEIHQIRDLNKS